MHSREFLGGNRHWGPWTVWALLLVVLIWLAARPASVSANEMPRPLSESPVTADNTPPKAANNSPVLAVSPADSGLIASAGRIDLRASRAHCSFRETQGEPGCRPTRSRSFPMAQRVAMDPKSPLTARAAFTICSSAWRGKRIPPWEPFLPSRPTEAEASPHRARFWVPIASLFEWRLSHPWEKQGAFTLCG